MRIAVLALALLLAIAAPTARAANPALEALLKSAGITYEIDADGDYKVVVEWTQEKRSQLAFVSSEVEDLEGLKLYTLMSPARILPETGIDPALAKRLLSDNATYKVGAWEIAGRNLYFTSKFPTTITPEQLHALVFTTTEVADNLEMELDPGKDDL